MLGLGMEDQWVPPSGTSCSIMSLSERRGFKPRGELKAGTALSVLEALSHAEIIAKKPAVTSFSVWFWDTVFSKQIIPWSLLRLCWSAAPHEPGSTVGAMFVEGQSFMDVIYWTELLYWEHVGDWQLSSCIPACTVYLVGGTKTGGKEASDWNMDALNGTVEHPYFTIHILLHTFTLYLQTFSKSFHLLFFKDEVEHAV